MLLFIGGVLVGGCVGMLLTALVTVSRHDDWPEGGRPA